MRTQLKLTAGFGGTFSNQPPKLRQFWCGGIQKPRSRFFERTQIRGKSCRFPNESAFPKVHDPLFQIFTLYTVRYCKSRKRFSALKRG